MVMVMVMVMVMDPEVEDPDLVTQAVMEVLVKAGE